jgi:hypothetical protein
MHVYEFFQLQKGNMYNISGSLLETLFFITPSVLVYLGFFLRVAQAFLARQLYTRAL